MLGPVCDGTRASLRLKRDLKDSRWNTVEEVKGGDTNWRSTDEEEKLNFENLDRHRYYQLLTFYKIEQLKLKLALV